MDPLSPREIQARVRAGASPEDLAAETGWDLERIERYAQPLIVERAFVADAARDVVIRTPRGAMELERAVTEVLYEAGVPVHLALWDSWRRPDGRWIVTLTFPVADRVVRASWGFDLRGKVLADIDEAARWAVGASDISLDDLVRMQTVVLPTRRRARREAADTDQDLPSPPPAPPAPPRASRSAGAAPHPSAPRPAAPRPAAPRPVPQPHGAPRRPVGPPRARLGERTAFHEALATAEVLDTVALAHPDSEPDVHPTADPVAVPREPWIDDQRRDRDSQPVTGGLFRRLAVVPRATAPDAGNGVEATSQSGSGLIQASRAQDMDDQLSGDDPDRDGTWIADGPDGMDPRDSDDGETIEPEAPIGELTDERSFEGVRDEGPESPEDPDSAGAGAPIVARSPGEVPRPVTGEPHPWRPGHPTNPGIRRPRQLTAGSTWDAVTGGTPSP